MRKKGPHWYFPERVPARPPRGRGAGPPAGEAGAASGTRGRRDRPPPPFPASLASGLSHAASGEPPALAAAACARIWPREAPLPPPAAPTFEAAAAALGDLALSAPRARSETGDWRWRRSAAPPSLPASSAFSPAALPCTIRKSMAPAAAGSFADTCGEFPGCGSLAGRPSRGGLPDLASGEGTGEGPPAEPGI